MLDVRSGRLAESLSDGEVLIGTSTLDSAHPGRQSGVAGGSAKLVKGVIVPELDDIKTNASNILEDGVAVDGLVDD